MYFPQLGSINLSKSLSHFGGISFFFNLFIYFGVCWVSVSMQVFLYLWQEGLLSSCNAQVSRCRSLSCHRAQALECLGFGSCGSQALEHRLSSCGTCAELLGSTWDIPGPGIEPESPALASRFFTTEPRGKPLAEFLENYKKLIIRRPVLREGCFSSASHRTNTSLNMPFVAL